MVEQRGVEPLTSALRTRRSAKLSYCPLPKCILGSVIHRVKESLPESGWSSGLRIPASHTHQARARTRNASRPQTESARLKPPTHSRPPCPPRSRVQSARTLLHRWSRHSHPTHTECHSRVESHRRYLRRERVWLPAQRTLLYKWTRTGKVL